MTDKRFQRLAEMVADQLRDRILRGDLQDGDTLPKIEELREEFPMSNPPLREALRILEAEGLIHVRRGNVGGAVVRRPTAQNLAYTVSLVLATERIDLVDVAKAVREMEATCAARCALRTDRAREVVPALRALHTERLAATEEEAMRQLSEALHSTIVDLSGDTTLIAMVRSLQVVWRTQDTGWRRDRRGDLVTVPSDSARRATLVAHERIIDLIEVGDAAAARSHMRRHLDDTHRYPKPPHGTGMIDPLRVRDAAPRPLTWT